MKSLRHLLTAGLLLSLATSPFAQRLGITDIMRGGGVQLPPTPSRTAPQPAGTPKQRSAEYIVALVNSEPITNSEVQVRVQRVLRENPQAAGMPRAELTKAVLERLINERAQLQVAKEVGIKVDELAIQQAEQTVARQNQLTLAELRARVSAEGISAKTFHDDLRDQLYLERLRDREIESKVKVTDVEVDQYLQDQKSNAQSLPPNLNIAQVLVAVPESATEAQVAQLDQRAQQIAQRARGGDDFAKLVRDYSDAPDKANGGALGLRSADRYPSLFVEAIGKLPVNGVAGPVRSGAGFHVLKLLARNDASADPVVTQTHARHILLRVDDRRSTAQAVSQLNEFKTRLQNGTADFAGLARDNSQDGSSTKGGDLGWTHPGQFVPEFEEAMNRLAPGQISDPIVSRFGVHLIQVMERRDSKLSPAERRDTARAELREKKLEEAFTTWAQETRARAYVEYRDPPES